MKKKQLAVSLTLLMAGILFFAIDLPTALRTENPSVNYVVYALFCFLIPIAVATAGLSVPKRWPLVLSLFTAVTVGIPLGVLGILAINEAMRIQRIGHDPSLQPLQGAGDGVYQYRLYRTNCGATCAFGLELRKERPLLMGLKLVRPIWSLYGAEEGSFILTTQDIVISYDGLVARIPK